MLWWEPRLIVGSQMELIIALAGRRGAIDVIYIVGCSDIAKRDDSGRRGFTGKRTREKMMIETERS